MLYMLCPGLKLQLDVLWQAHVHSMERIHLHHQNGVQLSPAWDMYIACVYVLHHCCMSSARRRCDLK